MENNNDNSIDLIRGNVYKTLNLENSHSVYNMFINQLGQLQTFFGYELAKDNLSSNSRYLCYLILKGNLVKEDVLILVEEDGVFISRYNEITENFVQILPKLLFVDARLNIYPNATTWKPNINRYSIVGSEQNIIYITDGSTGGLYILYISYLPNGQIDSNVYFKQFQYSAIKTIAGVSISPVDGDNNIVNLVWPSQLAYLSTHVIVVDDYTGGMYVIDNLVLFDNATPLDPVNYENTTLSFEIRMVVDPSPITTIKELNSELYVIGQNSIEKWYASSSLRPIQRYPNILEKTGASFRKAIYKFNNMLFFLGSSDDQQLQIKLWDGKSSSPIVLGVDNNSNLNVLFTNVKNLNDITMTAFEMWGQMFGVVNFGKKTGYNFSILINLQTQDSFYLVDKLNEQNTRFLADDFFQFKNKYFFLAWNTNEIYKFDYKYTSYNKNRIDCSVKTQTFLSGDNKLLKVSNLRIAFDNLPQYYYNNIPHSCIPVLQANANTAIQILVKNLENKWSHWNNMYIPVNRRTFHKTIKENIVIGYNVQLQIYFFQASSLTSFNVNEITTNQNLVYFPVILNNMAMDVTNK